MERYWLGIDAGTTAIKAGVYRRDGTLVSLGAAANEVKAGADGCSEQDMEGVWSGVCRAVRAALAGIDPLLIASVGIAAQGDGLWSLDARNRPAGPAVLWNDTRASDTVAELYATGKAKAVSRACHTSIWPGTAGTIFHWLRRNDPARADRIAKVIYCADWVAFRLSGEIATDYSDASIPFLDLNAGGYNDDALAALDCTALTGKLPAPRPADSRLGSVTAAAAQETGLPEGTPVAVGTMDLSAMIVGMGMDRPGETMMILGTTAVVNTLIDHYIPSDLPVGATAFHANGRIKNRILAPTTGAAAFDWFCALHPRTLGGATPAEISGKLSALARDVPPGANGVTFLPYLNGERAPFVAPKARGAFAGLSAASTKADMGRAVMEGCAFSLRHCCQAEGVRAEGLMRLTGGGARNALWCRIIADVMQVPIVVSKAADHGLWGAACLGAAAAGEGESCALARRGEDTVRYDPEPSAAAACEEAFGRYLAVSDACRSIGHS